MTAAARGACRPSFACVSSMTHLELYARIDSIVFSWSCGQVASFGSSRVGGNADLCTPRVACKPVEKILYCDKTPCATARCGDENRGACKSIECA